MNTFRVDAIILNIAILRNSTSMDVFGRSLRFSMDAESRVCILWRVFHKPELRLGKLETGTLFSVGDK